MVTVAFRPCPQTLIGEWLPAVLCPSPPVNCVRGTKIQFFSSSNHELTCKRQNWPFSSDQVVVVVVVLDGWIGGAAATEEEMKRALKQNTGSPYN